MKDHLPPPPPPGFLWLSRFVENPDNPSEATDEAFARLVEKLRRVPDALAANRIAYVTDDPRFPQKRLVISGNKRLRALKLIYGDDGKIPVEWTQDITPMTTEQRRVFLVAANVVEGEWDAALMRELYSAEELAPLLGDDALEGLLEAVSVAASPDAAAESETVELAITLPADDYRRAYVALVSRNEDISKAFMEFVNERA